jgi:hypothetical protein
MESNETKPTDQEQWNDNSKKVIEEQEAHIKEIEDDDDEVITIN